MAVNFVTCPINKKTTIPVQKDVATPTNKLASLFFVLLLKKMKVVKARATK